MIVTSMKEKKTMKQFLSKELLHYFNGKEMKPKKDNCTLKFCKKCNKVHETYYENSGAKKNQHIVYEDMPTYGLERETCRECR